MIEATGYVDYFLIMNPRYLLRQFLIIGVTMSKLTVVTSSESVNVTILAKCYRMIAPTSDLHYVDSFGDIGSCRLLILWYIRVRERYRGLVVHP